jgi:hypothetical protein
MLFGLWAVGRHCAPVPIRGKLLSMKRTRWFRIPDMNCPANGSYSAKVAALLAGTKAPRSRATIAEATGANATAAVAIGTLAVGALAVGFLVIGRLIIRELLVKRAHLGHLKIDQLDVEDLRVSKLTVLEEQRSADGPKSQSNEPSR